jgi:alkylation response protein AidB-like acyl-CoA dehydrogenase
VELELSDEQSTLVDVFASIAQRFSTTALVRAHESLGFSSDLWKQLVDAGAPGIALPEHFGGAGAGLLEVALAVEVLGRHLAPVALIEHVVAARLLAAVSKTLPDGVVDGTAISTVALRPPTRGVTRLVPAGAVAHIVLVLCDDDLVMIRAEPPGRAVPNLASAPLADRSVEGGTVVVSGARARELYEQALSEWRALTGAALGGLGRGALELTLEYVRGRHQFGRPIGSFQAIQHSLADIAVALDGAQLLARKAAWALDHGRADGPELAAMALLFAGERAQHATERGLHFHGGYGFMQEYDIQLYYRRAKGWPLVLGPSTVEYQRLGERRYGSIAGAA